MNDSGARRWHGVLRCDHPNDTTVDCVLLSTNGLKGGVLPETSILTELDRASLGNNRLASAAPAQNKCYNTRVFPSFVEC